MVFTRHKITNHPCRQCRAIATLEVIVTLPIFLIALLAIVEFGLLWTNEQNVAMASRAGAQVASRLTFIPLSGPVPTDVENAIAAELNKIGVSKYHLRLEHNIDFANNPNGTLTPVVLTTTSAGGPTNCPAPAPITLSPNRRYLRVTVCVATTSLTPNLLAMFGADLSNRISNESTTRRYAR